MTRIYSFVKAFPKLFWSLQQPKSPETVPWLATILLPDYFLETAKDNQAITFLKTCEAVLFWATESLAHKANEKN